MLFRVRIDLDAYDVALYASGSDFDAHLYVEHNVSDVKKRVREPKCIGEDSDDSDSDDNDSADSGDDAHGVHFSDSEDERTITLNDGFDPAPTQKALDNNSKMVLSHPPVKYTGPETKVDDHEYCSDELGSSDPDDSDEDSGPKNLKFRRSQLNKDFKFEKDMEFNTLNDFRFAIRHWNILNGFTLDWVKNESYRVRVVCSRKCGYFVYCSQVGHKHTYAIKTMGKAHTCGRDTSNKSASSKWVAHNIMDKMQTTQKVGIRDIIQDIRRNYAVDITKGKASRAKKIASKIIEGDGDKQYAMIRRYAAELRRVSKANTIKINVERPNPTLLPRFGSFYFCFEGCKKGFIHGCRPFIGVDECHLKTKYGGQLLIAVGRDPNDQYFPLAFGVVETETKESWRWFLQLLMEDLGEDKRYVFISDQQKVTHLYFLIYFFIFCYHILCYHLLLLAILYYHKSKLNQKWLYDRII
jgi:hypothetical protein